MDLSIGIVGLGAAARAIHIPAIKRVDGLRIVGGADPAAQGEFPFPVFRNLGDLLAAQVPDIVGIVTPPDTHRDLILEALEAGAHVFAEKPLVLTLDEAGLVIDRADRLGKFLVVNNEFRFMNVHQAAAALIGTSEFGDLRFVDMTQTFRVSEETEKGWRGDLTRRTCFEFGTHVLDLARFFMGSDPTAIAARMPKPGAPGGPDYLNLIHLEFPGDRVAQITLDRLSKGRHRYLDIRLDGEAATVETSLGGRAEVAFGVEGGSRRPYLRTDFAPSAVAELWQGNRRKRIATDPFDLFAHATSRVLRSMADAIGTGGTPECEARDNVGTLRLMLAAYDSAESGGARIALDRTDEETEKGEKIGG